MLHQPDYILREFLPEREVLDRDHFYVCQDDFLLLPRIPQDDGTIWCSALSFPRGQRLYFELEGSMSHLGHHYEPYKLNGDVIPPDSTCRVRWVVVFDQDHVPNPESLTSWHKVLGKGKP